MSNEEILFELRSRLTRLVLLEISMAERLFPARLSVVRFFSVERSIVERRSPPIVNVSRLVRSETSILVILFFHKLSVVKFGNPTRLAVHTSESPCRSIAVTCLSSLPSTVMPSRFPMAVP